MLDEKLYCIVDYETRSRVDLKRAGAFEYAVDPSTEIICVAWKVGTRERLKNSPVHAYSSFSTMGADDIVGLLSCFKDPKITLIAHNAFFEQVITKYVLSRHFDFEMPAPHRWQCTAAMAAALALPRSLEEASLALKLTAQKDMAGRRLIMKYCKPRKPTKNNPDEWFSNASDFDRIVEYCKNDIHSETELFLKIPPLSENEQRVWVYDQMMNLRGFRVDIELVDKVLESIEEEKEYLLSEVGLITDGALQSANQRDKALEFLRAEGCELSDLRAGTVTSALIVKTLSEKAKRLLEIRQDLSKTSTAKYQAFKERSKHDGYVRDFQMYHGASTGRWSGRGVQIQNLTRGVLKNSIRATEIVKGGNLEELRLLYGSPMLVYSSILRNCIIPTEGHEFFCGDYAAIEARVLFWLAGHKYGIQAYKDKRDLYKEMAGILLNKPPDEVTKEERFWGKTLILGCGYGLGHKKFRMFCQTAGKDISEDFAKDAVNTYREVHSPIPKLWEKLEAIGIHATLNKKKRFKTHNTIWHHDGEFLWCELPSGRKLAYYGAEVRDGETPWGETKRMLYHWGVNALTKKWERSGTYGGKLTENLVQAISRDLLVEAILRLDQAGYRTVLSVHDEAVCERLTGKGSLKEFLFLMGVNPPWATDCPVEVEGWQGNRYKK